MRSALKLRYKTAIKRFIVVNALGFLILTGSYSNIINDSRKEYSQNIQSVPYDVIIVPGVPFNGERWSNSMKIRVYWSYYLWKQGFVKNIIYSGSAVYTPYIESEIMAAHARSLGIPEHIIFIEKQAEHSTENIYYSEKMANRLGFEKIALATDPFQNNMVNPFRKKHYENVDALPVQFHLIDTIEMIDPTIDHESYIQIEFVSLPNREGFFKRFAGTLGKHVIDSINN